MSFDLSGLIVSFLGGCAVTSLGFLIAYGMRLSKVETALQALKDAVHTSPCPASQSINVKVEVLDNRVKQLEEKAENSN